MNSIEILIIDNHAVLSEGLSLLLRASNPDFIFYTAKDGKQAEEQIRLHPSCKLLLLDLTLDEESGLDVLKQLRTIRPDIKTIIFSMSVEPVKIEQSLHCNIQGYVSKSANAPEIARSIRTVATGGQAFCSEAQNVIQVMLTQSDSQNGTSKETQKIILQTKELYEEYCQLSEKEQEIFLLAAKGKTTKEIASLLGKTEKTVANQRTSAYQKLCIKNQYEAENAAKILGVI